MTHQAKTYLTALLLALAGLLLLSAPASAKQVVAYFGTASGSGALGGEFALPGDIAVNSSGAGPAEAGDIYVIERNFGNVRIQRFVQNDNGTLADPYDDSYDFISAWGADVVQAGGTGDLGAAAANYEICTVASECKAGVESGGNGTAAGNGSLNQPEGIAVDQDTGQVYISDTNNNRVNVYSGDGTFLRSFGWDVVEVGPGDTAGDEYEICIAADGDVCKGGTGGGGIGQFGNRLATGIAVSPPDGAPATGSVFVADYDINRRVNTYDLDGTSPNSFGSAANFANNSPEHVAVDSRGIVYITDRANNSEVDRYDSQNANGGGVGFLAPIPAPPLDTNNTQRKGLEVDPDSDGAGPDEDVLYSIRDGGSGTTVVQQFGPINDPGLTAPPAAQDDQHGLLVGFTFVGGLGLDTASGRLFVSSYSQVTNAPPQKHGVYVLDVAGGTPTASLDSVSDVTQTTATVNGTINPNGPPPLSYRLEYVDDATFQASGFANAESTPEIPLGSQTTDQAVSPLLDPPGTGLLPDTTYHVRLAVTKVFNPPVLTAAGTFTTLPAPPQVETTGAPLRTTATAQLTGRVNPRGAATTYHFEYGTQGPCDSNPCEATAVRAAGSGQLLQLVAEEVSGLAPDTTYHYRIVAGNGNAGSPVAGEDMTVTTRASDAPLSHGSFPGPPGSDRAWEMVSTPDTSGNPVNSGLGFSDNGSRALYRVVGGTPLSQTSHFFGAEPLLAERPPGTHPQTGWQTNASVIPPRSELPGQFWTVPGASNDLSSIVSANLDNLAVDSSPLGFFRLSPQAAPNKLLQLPKGQASEPSTATSDDGATVVAILSGAHDPAYPLASGDQLYDLSEPQAPRLISLLPDGSVPACDVDLPNTGFPGSVWGPSPRPKRWLSADGALAFFSCGGGLYLRDLQAQATRLIAPAASFLKSTPGAAFFTTAASLDPGDGGGMDVYRYDVVTESRDCLTCLVAGLDAAVSGNVAVAPDGSRLYFKSANTLVPGAAAGGIYRVNVESGELRYLAQIYEGVGENAGFSQAINPDGTVLIFGSSAATLNPLGDGADNVGSFQYYRYDDRDRSLACVSCPQDGSAPAGSVGLNLIAANMGPPAAPNLTALAADGSLAFATATPLLPADQNTPPAGQDPALGTDIYEWRDGRLLLVTDGLTEWHPLSTPVVQGVSPSGHDLFFTAAAQLTPDALDSFTRLYDARIGGGIDFPDPPVPCPLEVCQGTPRGAPDDPFPSSTSFTGRGNLAEPPPARKCRKGQRKVRRAGKVRCVPRKHKRANKQRRANRDRRAAR